MEYLPRSAQRTQGYSEDLIGGRNTTHEIPRASRHFLPICARFSSRLYLRTGSQILSIGSADLVGSQLVTRRSPICCLRGILL